MDSKEAEEKPLVIYDIASAPPRTTFAPNPWKARLALNFKSASYRTNWVELPDVESTRTSLRVPASRKFPDGSDFCTLPILYDSAKDRYIGDSFDIALYLDDRCPDGPRLVPDGMAGVVKAWNDRVDPTFSAFMRLLAHNIPLNPENAEECRQILVARGQAFGEKGKVMTWDDCTVTGDDRVTMLAEFKTALDALDVYYQYTSGNAGQGPFLNGEIPTYADIVVGAWLCLIHQTLPADELADFQTWHNGRWGNIWKALEKYTCIV